MDTTLVPSHGPTPECHYLKNPKAQRTQAVLGKWDKVEAKRVAPIAARRKAFLTGTPLPNRPIEGQPIFAALCPARFGNWMRYATRYCGAYRSSFGWDVSGASNLPELQRELRESIMVRRLKADVLPELPAKRRAVIEIPANGASGAVAAESDAFDRNEDVIADMRAAVELAKASDSATDYANAVGALREAMQASFVELSKLRHATALAKTPYVVAHLQDVLEDGEGKVVCMAWHHDVVQAVADAFGDAAVVVTGATAMADRQAAVDRFQTDPTCRVFVGTIKAAGVGITLTAAAHVVFAELHWVPGDVTQAEDRCHRIGQTDSVLIQHLVLEGSLDARMAQILVDKQNVLDTALDREIPEPDLVDALKAVAATATATRKAIETAAAEMTPEEILEVHTDLRRLAAVCDGAKAEDGMGFNGLDTRIGKSLAACVQLTARQAALGKRLTHKYRRQLGK